MNNQPDLRAMSEEEWFQTPFTLDELEAQYQDPSTEKYRREHAFYRYWKRRLADEAMFSRSEYERLMEHPQWIHPIGDIIEALCVRDAIDQGDVPWLLSVLPVESYAFEQLTLLSLLRDPAVSWQEKLRRVLDSRAEWARRRVMETLPLSEADQAEEIIAGSRCGRRTRNYLLQILLRRKEAAR